MSRRELNFVKSTSYRKCGEIGGNVGMARRGILRNGTGAETRERPIRFEDVLSRRSRGFS
jgi:hypothetical protein